MSLKVWLPLNGTLENKGVSNINIVNENATINTAGKIGSCYAFNGDGYRIHLSGDDLFKCIKGGNQPFSIAMWVFHEDSRRAILFGDYNSTGAINVNIELTTDHIVRFYWNGNPDYRTGVNIGASIWSHLTMTYDGNKLCTYLNGALAATNNITLLEKNKTSGEFFLGRDYRTSETALKGRLNDFRVYDHCLSAAEVHEISQGLVLHYKLDSIPYNFSTNNVTAFTNFTFGRYYYTIFSINTTDFIAQTGAVNGDKFTFSVDINATSGTKQLAARLQHFNSSSDRNSVIGNYIAAGQSGRSSITFTLNTAYTRLDFMINNGDSGSVTANSTEQYKCTRIEKGDVHTGYIQTGITPYIQDSSGYGHNGTILNTITLSSDTPHYSASTNLTAGNSMINCGRGAMVTDSLTVNLWIKYSTWSNPISCTESGGWNFENSSGIQFPVYIASVGYKIANAGTLPSANTWHMITGIYDRIGQAVKIYIDGELKQSTATGSSNLIGYNSSNVIWIGAEATGNNTVAYDGMVGLVSDFRIYATALSAADIKQLYEVGAKVDNLQNLHTYEIKEVNCNLLAGRLWSNWYNQHNPSVELFTNFNSKGEYQFTTNMTSAGTEYIPINPTGHTYEYDYTISINAGNQFYIGFERYDANKTARSNNACVYTFGSKPGTDIVKKHYHGTVNLSTDGVNPCAFIALRILNGWSGTTSGVTGTATIHNISLREIGVKQQPKLTKQGQFIEEELKEEANMKLHKNGIVETNNLIEL